MSKDKFIAIYDWMFELPLDLTEMVTYAIIFSFSKGGSYFFASQNYLENKCKCSRTKVYYTLNRLVEKGMIRKIYFEKNIYAYTAFEDDGKTPHFDGKGMFTKRTTYRRTGVHEMNKVCSRNEHDMFTTRTSPCSPDEPYNNSNIRISDKKIDNNSVKRDGKSTRLKGENSSSSSRKRFVKPSVQEISAYCAERNNDIDAQEFFDFYESKGWVIGKSAMKDWKAAVRTWESKRKSERSSAPRYQPRRQESVFEYNARQAEEAKRNIMKYYNPTPDEQ